MSDADPLERVKTWDAHGNPYWNGVAKSAKKAPGVGKLHRARIEDGRVVEVECHARVESWVAFTADSVPQEDRRTCSNCGDLSRVPGVKKQAYWSVELTEDYDPERWSPKPLTDGGTSRGLYDKYEVTKGGESVDDCFVLEPESDPAAREALLAYADATDDETLADDLCVWVNQCVRREEDR